MELVEGEQVYIEGDHGLIIRMSKDMYKHSEIKKEGNQIILKIKSEKWEEVL